MTQLKPQASYDDFARLDIRIGKVVEVQPFPRARNPSLKVGVVGSLVVCICNLGAKNIAGFTSELLILGAKDADGKVIVLGPRSAVAIGEPIF
jgi:tRNA-binding protein